MIADVFVKGLGGFDRDKAYAAIRKNGSIAGPAMEPGPASWENIKQGRFADYFALGYLPIDTPLGGNTNSSATSRTLEYAVSDFGIASVAEILAKSEDAKHFKQRSLNGRKLWNPDTQFFRAKDRTGEWVDGFKPTLNPHSYQGPLYEGTPWKYRFAMRHDVGGMIRRLGGNQSFLNILDQYFDGGFHAQDNQPTLLTPWLHTYAGPPDKNVDRVRAAMEKNHRAERKGLPGTNKYVQSAALNGKVWNKAWLRHRDIVNGADLVLKMGDKPSDLGTNEAPPSLTSATQKMQRCIEHLDIPCTT